ncbi:hypothetical protein [Aquimarina sediminis]|uniref:hypothetical protein n=1 Tax=Aquimarina sediminis TaxID=2070536 RepID=UPI000CA03E53|nr:hypothetical protein [Aquimarina sediminis]
MFGWLKKSKSSTSANRGKLDFSTIDSNEKAIELYEKGELVKMYLMPIVFGGQDNSLNTLYAPKFALGLKERFDKKIEKELMNGKRLSYSGTPKYKGKSFIPSKLVITVSGDSDFRKTIAIW